MNELLRLENVSYRYEDKYTGLRQVSATIRKGERVAVLGANGAGKSTFFRCCNGLLSPQEGAVFLRGRAVTGSKTDLSVLRQTVGLVFQDPDSQILAGTVESEISFGPMNLRLELEEVQRRTQRSVVQMGLQGYENRAPQYLSGGEKKRVSMADILAMQPEMILFDEPTASLDPENVTLLERTLDQLSLAGIALVVATHDANFAYRFATRAIVFRRGEILADAPVDEVFDADKLLAAAGLEKPLLYAVAELLAERFPLDQFPERPRTIDALRELLAHL